MAIDGVGEGSEFTGEDVGNFLQKMFGDRNSENGQEWDVGQVQVIRDEESGMIVISNLNPNQYGTKWIGGKECNFAISELLFAEGFSPFYSLKRLTAMVPEDKFTSVNLGVAAQIDGNTESLVDPSLASIIDGVLTERGYPIR